jgi:hypothetical protein
MAGVLIRICLISLLKSKKANIVSPKSTYLAMAEATMLVVALMSGVMKLLKFCQIIQHYSAGRWAVYWQ